MSLLSRAIYLKYAIEVQRDRDQIKVVRHCNFSRYAFLSESDRSKVTQNKINFVKKFLQWGLNPQPPDHHFRVPAKETLFCSLVALYPVVKFWFVKSMFSDEIH